MNVICEKCERVLINNQWVIDVLPIGKVSYTVCPKCLAEESSKDKPSHRMVYQQVHQDKQSHR